MEVAIVIAFEREALETFLLCDDRTKMASVAKIQKRMAMKKKELVIPEFFKLTILP